MGRVYRVNQIFYSLQGEGNNQGMPFVFVRFSGCNQACSFCDTDHSKWFDATASDILEMATTLGYKTKNVLFTGGEPGLQLDMELIAKFHSWYIAVETNGSVRLPYGIDYIACSPKLKLLKIDCADELRYAIKANDPLPTPNIYATHHFLSPVFDGQKLNRKNLDYCALLCKNNPPWRLSVQIHKLLEIP